MVYHAVWLVVFVCSVCHYEGERGSGSFCLVVVFVAVVWQGIGII